MNVVLMQTCPTMTSRHQSRCDIALARGDKPKQFRTHRGTHTQILRAPTAAPHTAQLATPRRVCAVQFSCAVATDSIFDSAGGRHCVAARAVPTTHPPPRQNRNNSTQTDRQTDTQTHLARDNHCATHTSTRHATPGVRSAISPRSRD